MRCSDCAASRDRRTFTVVACLVTWGLVAPLAWAGWRGTPAVVPSWWHALGGVGPLVAALVVLRRREGGEGLAEWRHRVLDWRVGGRWWVAALLLPPAALAVGVGVLAVSGAPGWDAAALAARATPGWWVDAVVVGGIAFGAMGEPGWRGWLLPHLRTTRGPVRATLALWPAWAAWHAPFVFYRLPPGVTTPVAFLAGLLALALVLSWLAEASGSAVPAAAFQASLGVVLAVGEVAAPGALAVAWWMLAAAAAGVVAHWWWVPRRAAVALADRSNALAAARRG